MSPMLAIARISLKRFFRDRANYFFVLILPMLLVVALGLQFGDAGAAGRLVLTGSGPLSDRLASALDDQRIAVERTGDPEGARQVVARGRSDAAVLVTADDEARWASKRPVQVTIISGSQADGQATTATVRSVLDSLSGDRAALAAIEDQQLEPETAKRALRKAADVGPAMRVKLVGEDLGKEFSGLGQFDLGAAQQLSLFMFLTAMSGSSLLIQSRELGVTRRQLATPVSAMQVIGGEALGRFVIAATQGIYMVVGTGVLFGVNWGNPLATGCVVIAFSTVSASAAMVLGSSMDNANAAVGVGIGIGLIAAGLGGSMLPLELFPDGLMKVSAFSPHHWAYEAYSEIQRRGGGVADVLPQLAVLLAMTAVLLPLGAWLLRRSMSRAL